MKKFKSFYKDNDLKEFEEDVLKGAETETKDTEEKEVSKEEKERQDENI